MKIKSYLAYAITLTTAIPTFAFAFFCPTNFNQIDFGMTVDEVTEQCGKPDTQKESEKVNDNIPQEWSYYIPQTVSMGGSTPNAQGTLKTSMTFDDKGKAINISVNGIGVGASTICGTSLKLGDDKDAIKSACGEPALVVKQKPPEGSPEAIPAKIIEFTYSQVAPAVTLVFENGKLTDKK